MPSATPGGFPYPVPPEPVRDGAANIQALATEVDKRLGPQAVVGIKEVATFDQNGLWYAPPWTNYGMTWTGMPGISAMVGQTTVGADAGVNVQVFQPHNTILGMVFQANYAKDGRTFQGAIDMYIIAAGPGKRI